MTLAPKRGLRRVQDAGLEPVALADMKLYLKVDQAEEDGLIAELVKAARQAAERFTGRAFITQTWRLTLDAFPGGARPWWDGVREGAEGAAAAAIELPYPPLQTVSALATLDEAGVETVFAAENYIVDAEREPGRVLLKSGRSWPALARAGAAVRITYLAGYGPNAQDVPAPIAEGIRLHVAALYENREGGEIPPAAKALYAPFRLARL